MIEKTYHIITFGCQMNVHDSHWLGRALNARGFFEAPLEDAQVVVVNTCSVREKPEQKVMSTLGRIRQVSGGNPAVLVCVAGCVAQAEGAEIMRRAPQVDIVVGPQGIHKLPELVAKATRAAGGVLVLGQHRAGLALKRARRQAGGGLGDDRGPAQVGAGRHDDHPHHHCADQHQRKGARDRPLFLRHASPPPPYGARR